MRSLKILGFLFLAISVAPVWGEEPATFYEASGVAFAKGRFLLVDDSFPMSGVVFEYEHAAGVDEPFEVALVDTEVTPRLLRFPERITDLESVAVLPDGDFVVLSESWNALFRCRPGTGETIPLCRFDDRYVETYRFDRGMEGVDVLTTAGGGARILSVYEGGYFKRPFGATGARFDTPHSPEIVVHSMGTDEGRGRAALTVERTSVLTMPDYPDEVRAEPAAYRFRVPDIVWDRDADGIASGERVIALLSSASSPPEGESYGDKFLQRFDLEGNAVGPAVNLSTLVENPGLNWEGLCWVAPGKSLALVAEDNRTYRPMLAVVDVPEWRMDSVGER